MKSYLLFIALLTNLTVLGQNLGPVQRLDGTLVAADVIDPNVSRLMGAAKVDGLQLAIINNNNVVYRKAYGFEDYIII